MKKKTIWLVTILLLVSLIMVGCQSAEETAAPEEDASEDMAEEAPAEMETVTITIWDFGGSEACWSEISRVCCCSVGAGVRLG